MAPTREDGTLDIHVLHGVTCHARQHTTLPENSQLQKMWVAMRFFELKFDMSTHIFFIPVAKQYDRGFDEISCSNETEPRYRKKIWYFIHANILHVSIFNNEGDSHINARVWYQKRPNQRRAYGGRPCRECGDRDFKAVHPHPHIYCIDI